MRVLAVPVKRLSQAKRRLSGVLFPQERATLTMAMMADVLAAATVQPGWDVWVVSRQHDVLRAGAQAGAHTIAEEGETLSAAVRQVEDAMEDRDELAVLLADLPLITPGALAAALSLPGPVVAAPAESDGGTNLLVRRPGSAIGARFGRSSFAKHRAEAYRKGLTFHEARLPELAFDLDRPADLERILAERPRGRTWQACRDMGLAERLRVGA